MKKTLLALSLFGGLLFTSTTEASTLANECISIEQANKEFFSAKNQFIKNEIIKLKYTEVLNDTSKSAIAYRVVEKFENSQLIGYNLKNIDNGKDRTYYKFELNNLGLSVEKDYIIVTDKYNSFKLLNLIEINYKVTEDEMKSIMHKWNKKDMHDVIVNINDKICR